jgi:hypothetical protein
MQFCCGVQVSDAGPGLTLGRWLDMRGLQITSHPLKGRSSTARFKRPADVGGRGIVSAAELS